MICLQNIGFQYKMTGQYGLFDINLLIKRGEMVVITGQGGCGKTTILKLLQGRLPAYEEGVLSGKVEIFGSLVCLNIEKHKIPYDIAIDADVVMLDEPLQSLQYEEAEELLFVLDRWKKEGKTIVITEKQAEQYRRLADRILLMENGRIKVNF